MRFVSKYGKYAMQIRPQIVEAYATGLTRVLQPQITAQFQVGIANGDERAMARQRFAFNGFYQEEDMVPIAPPDYRNSAFASRLAAAEHGWTDEERELVETVLMREAERMPQDLFVVEEERALAPWPNYDTFSGNRAQLLRKLQEDGFDLAAVHQYEAENQNRREILAMLEKAIDEGEVEAPVEELEEE